MSELKIFSGNRLEILADRLAAVVRQPMATAIEPETVIVQSRGMERWVAMALARRNGICANLLCPFPNAFLESLFRRFLPDLPEPLPFAPEVLTFRIMKRLPALVQRPSFSALGRYLADDAKGLKCFRLAVRLADLFDQYLVFRPQMIRRWEAGQVGDSADSRWQAKLWRDLMRGHETPHRAQLHRDLLARLSRLPAPSHDLPSRVSVFGISYLAPFHLQALVALARVTPVYLFLLNPCREYWGDIMSRRDINRLAGAVADENAVADDLHLEQGHPLLASLGGAGKDFLAAVGGLDAPIEDCFVPVDGSDLLSTIQADIFHLRSPAAFRSRHPDGAAGARAASADGSIQIHVCHSPLREIEVLHDRLLALFEENPDIAPRDIIVMTPDIVTYSPYVQAVFDAQGPAGQTIPYGIADCGAGTTNTVVRSFLSLLDLKGSRFEATRVLGLLELPGIRERFGLTATDQPLIERWVREANIRWGRDARGCARLGLPEVSENTWQAGIDRLLLGYAMPGDGRSLFGGILPHGPIEGREAVVLGRFVDFLRHLFDWTEQLEHALSPAAWRQRLAGMLERFIATGDGAEEDAQELRRRLDDLGALEERAGFTAPLELEVVRDHLENVFAQGRGSSGFISGGVTFCTLLPMRSVPFEVVCLVGMNAATFPREDIPPGFDLMARSPKPGDRSRRREDKYLFLEALVSAGRVFYISYVGTSAQDNSEIPPSAVVSELIDAIETGYGIAAGQLMVRHPLQAYSLRYFDGGDPALFSYSADNFNAAAATTAASRPPSFLDTPLPPPSTEWCRVRLEQLCQFFSQPARFLVEQRLGILLTDKDLLTEDKESFSLDALGAYRVRRELIETRMAENHRRDLLPVQRARGYLPAANVGRLFYENLSEQADALATRFLEITGNGPAESLTIDLRLAGIRLTGMLEGLYPRGLIRVHFARRRAKDYLSAWIHHLVLCQSRGRHRSAATFLVGTDGVARLRPVERPEALLAQLLETFRQGLCRPLPFFPDAAMDFLNLTHAAGKPVKSALETIRTKWTGSDFRRGAAVDPYHRLCFGNADPFGETFIGLAEAVGAPLRRHLEEAP